MQLHHLINIIKIKSELISLMQLRNQYQFCNFQLMMPLCETGQSFLSREGNLAYYDIKCWCRHRPIFKCLFPFFQKLCTFVPGLFCDRNPLKNISSFSELWILLLIKIMITISYITLLSVFLSICSRTFVRFLLNLAIVWEKLFYIFTNFFKFDYLLN